MIFQAFHDKVRTDVNPDGPKTMTRRSAEMDDWLFWFDGDGEVCGAMTVEEYFSDYEYHRRHFGSEIGKVERNGRCLLYRSHRKGAQRRRNHYYTIMLWSR